MDNEMDTSTGIRRYFMGLARTGTDLESFLKSCLPPLGDLTRARALTLEVRDNSLGETVFRAVLTPEGNSWRLILDEKNSFPSYTDIGAGRPRFVLRSSFYFSLDLSPHWSGTLVVSCGGIKIFSPAQYRMLTRILAHLSDSLYLMMVTRRNRRLARRVEEMEKKNHDLQRTMTGLTKEIYCVSRVFTVLSQSGDIVKNISRILKTTLPLLKARIGLVYFPETDHCISFRWAVSRYWFEEHRNHGEKPENLCLARYFQDQAGRLATYPDGVSFRQVAEDDPCFSVLWQNSLDAMRVRSVYEFSLCAGEKFFGLGLIGFREEEVRSDQSRLLMITLNMTSLFLKNLALMQDLEKEVKVKSEAIQGMEKEKQFIFDHVGRPLSPAAGKKAQSGKVLDQIDSSRKAVFLGELASGVAHQIRNPLNNLLAVLHLVRDRSGQTDIQDLLAQVTDRVETIHRMISTFIHYTRIPELNLTSESVNQVVENTLLSFKGQIDRSGVSVASRFDPRLTRSKMDLYLMNQVYHNIIKNALEAMDGKGRLAVETRSLEIKHGPNPHLGFAEILFRDSGPGIPEKELGRVMMPFFSRKKEGMGLGLAIVDHVVGLHGGAVKVENRSDGGTQVGVYLPIR